MLAVPRYTAVEPEVTALNAPAHRACRLPWNAQDQGPFGKLRAGSGAPSAWTGDLSGTGAARLVKREQPAVCDEEHAIRNLKLAI